MYVFRYVSYTFGKVSCVLEVWKLELGFSKLVLKLANAVKFCSRPHPTGRTYPSDRSRTSLFVCSYGRRTFDRSNRTIRPVEQALPGLPWLCFSENNSKFCLVLKVPLGSLFTQFLIVLKDRVSHLDAILVSKYIL